MIDVHAGAEKLAVAGDSAHRDAAEVDAVVPLDATDQARLAALAFCSPVRSRHLECRIGGFRARAGEEHAIQALWHLFHDAIGKLERERMAELERRRVVQ